MRRIADLHPGNAKTDARDAYIIAEPTRSMPHALRRVDTGDETRAPHSYDRLVDAVQQALTEQTVTVPGTRAAELVLPQREPAASD